MRPESKKLIEDMRDAAEQISSFIAGKTLDDFLASQQLRWSVERGFEIIGEALTQLKKIDPDIAAKISDYRKIIAFRNILIHGYTTIKHQTTWDITQNHLPVLRHELETLQSQP